MRKFRAFFLSVVLGSLLSTGAARGDVVVLSNTTGAEISFRQSDGAPGSDAGGTWTKILSDDIGLIHSIGRSHVAFLGGADGKEVVHRSVDANCVYRFVDVDGKGRLLERVFLGSDARSLGGTGIAVADKLLAVRTLPVKILVDDNQLLATPVWQSLLRKRLEQASRIFEKHCLLRFEVADFGEWDSDDSIDDFALTLAEFEREVPALSGGLVVGFTSQYTVTTGINKLGGTRGPLHPHVLISEQSRMISEGERLEVLVHELGHFLGASHSTAPRSVMRAQLGDRLARAAEFRIGFDPENTLAINLIAEELRIRNVSRRSELKPETGLRLSQIQKELDRRVQLKEAEELARRQKEKGNDPKNKKDAPLVAAKSTPRESTSEATSQQSETGQPASSPEAGGPEAGAPGAPYLFVLNKDLGNPALRQATQLIVARVRDAAEKNAGLPAPPADGKAKGGEYEGILFSEQPSPVEAQPAEKSDSHPDDEKAQPSRRLSGDDLMSYYVRAAAVAADETPREHAGAAFLLALGIALDNSDILLQVPQTGEFCRTVEPEEQRKRRIEVLGQPTVYGRRDLAQHFVVSAHLTVAVGRPAAEGAGLAKEIVDAERGTGFSFADLAANKAGIRLANEMLCGKIKLADVRQAFSVEKYVPSVNGLPEGLDSDRFQAEFGGGSNEHYAAVLKDISGRLDSLPAYRPQE